jgi:ParB-like chromosome segregation protein Spo0J
LDSLKPAPENNIYSTIAWDNPELRQLASSIREHGLLEPIRVSRDGFIISGHRRRMASYLAGLKEVPIQIDSLSRAKNPDGNRGNWRKLRVGNRVLVRCFFPGERIKD